MTKAMALEWAPYNINVNAICPAIIRTPLVAPKLKDQNL
jgi:2-deoxy-D-gluconate 3-dehydrogenase